MLPYEQVSYNIVGYISIVKNILLSIVVRLSLYFYNESLILTCIFYKKKKKRHFEKSIFYLEFDSRFDHCEAI